MLLCCIVVSFALSAALTAAQAQTNPNAILRGEGTAAGIGADANNPVTLADCTNTGNCSIEHILLLANSIIRWAVAISGSVALLMYVIGGVWMIFSQGNSSRIEHGKDIIVGTSISLIFILGGWLIIQFALQSVGAKSQFLLKPNNCGTSGECPYGQVCSKNKCVERCVTDKAEKDPDHPWQCQDMNQCGIASANDCSAHSGNCALNLCITQPANIVCCWNPNL